MNPKDLDKLPSSEPTDEQVAQAEILDELRNFLYGLSVPTMNALVLVVYRGFAHSQAARASGCKVVQLRRALKELERRLKSVQN